MGNFTLVLLFLVEGSHCGRGSGAGDAIVHCRAPGSAQEEGKRTPTAIVMELDGLVVGWDREGEVEVLRESSEQRRQGAKHGLPGYDRLDPNIFPSNYCAYNHNSLQDHSPPKSCSQVFLAIMWIIDW